MPEQFEFLILNAPERIRQGASLFGVRLDSGRPELASQAECAIIAAAGRKRTKELLKLARAHSRRVLLEVSTAEEAVMAGDLGFDGVVSKTPLAAPVPVWGLGGIGLHSAAAWYAGGGCGAGLRGCYLGGAGATLPHAARHRARLARCRPRACRISEETRPAGVSGPGGSRYPHRRKPVRCRHRSAALWRGNAGGVRGHPRRPRRGD